MQLQLLRLLLQLPPLPPQQPLPSPPPTQSSLNISNARPQPFSEMGRKGKNLRWEPVTYVAIPPADTAVAANALADDMSNDDAVSVSASTTNGDSLYCNSDDEVEAAVAVHRTAAEAASGAAAPKEDRQERKH